MVLETPWYCCMYRNLNLFDSLIRASLSFFKKARPQQQQPHRDQFMHRFLCDQTNVGPFFISKLATFFESLMGESFVAVSNFDS